jgi:hypothetical protein
MKGEGKKERKVRGRREEGRRQRLGVKVENRGNKLRRTRK